MQNYSFDFKKKHKNKHGNEVGFFNGAYSEIEVSSCKNWTPIEILQRGKNMLLFLEERWGIDFNEGWGDGGDGIDKAELLRLTFLSK